MACGPIRRCGYLGELWYCIKEYMNVAKRFFDVILLSSLTPKEMRRIPLDCMEKGNIRIGLSSIDRASVCQVLASLPAGSFWDVKERLHHSS